MSWCKMSWNSHCGSKWDLTMSKLKHMYLYIQIMIHSDLFVNRLSVLWFWGLKHQYKELSFCGISWSYFAKIKFCQRGKSKLTFQMFHWFLSVKSCNAVTLSFDMHMNVGFLYMWFASSWDSMLVSETVLIYCCVMSVVGHHLKTNKYVFCIPIGILLWTWE